MVFDPPIGPLFRVWTDPPSPIINKNLSKSFWPKGPLSTIWTYQRLKCDVYIFYFYIYYVKCEPHYNIKSNLWFLYYCISPQLVCWLSLCNVLFPSSLIHSNIIREKRYRFNVLLHLFHNRTGHKFPWWQLAVDF